MSKEKHHKKILGILLLVLCVLIVLFVIVLNATVFAQQQEFTPEKCRSYYHEQDIYVPFSILMWFDEANSGGFFYNALRTDASYWIEKPEDYDADPDTFMGIGSNSTKRWEWQFNMFYPDVDKDRIPFQIEIISDGISIYRNDFRDAGKEVCTYLNFNAEVRPPELSGQDILEIADKLSQDQISSINARMRMVNETIEQFSNVLVAGLVIFGLVALVGVFRGRGLSKTVEILEEQYENAIVVTNDQEAHAKMSEDYYDLKRIHGEKNTNSILTRLKELEPFVNNVHFILQYIKKNMPNADKIILDDKPEHPDEYGGITEKIGSKIGIIKDKVMKSKSDTIDNYYSDYKRIIEKLDDKKKLEYVLKEWKNLYDKAVQNPDGEEIKRIEALRKLERELR